MTEQYNAGAIEVLNGLEPVRRRPGMYTDTARPNHLGQEVIDNSVDEALAGHASKVQVILHADQSLEVIDDGRGMPIDIHPDEKVSGVELILCKLHAGGKFSNKNYQFSGGLHGVGISVVNALSKRVEVTVRRDGQVYEIAFEHGDKVSDLTVVGTCGRRDRGTSVHFWPDAEFFDSANFSVTRLVNNLRAKAVLCPSLEITFTDKVNNKDYEWHYEDGLKDYLAEGVKDYTVLPEEPFTGEFSSETEAANWAVIWQPEGGEMITESYINLIPTLQGGTHVNGLRQGLLDAMREFCEFRNLLPRGVKLTGDDVFDRCSYVLSVKIQDPQFAGQTKERLSSRQTAAFVSGVVKDAFSLWLNEKPQLAEQLAEVCIANAHRRMRASKKVVRKKVASGPALPGKLTDCSVQDLNRTEIFFVEGDSAGGSAKQARDREFQAVMPLRGKILNTWEVSADQVLASQEVHDISVALGIDPDSDNLDSLRYGKICILADADSDGLHIATLLCALFTRHFRALVEAGHIYVAMPPLYRIDCGKEVFYALDDDEKDGVLERLSKKKAKINVQRFKGLGEMNPLQLRETTMDPNTRRLVQLTIDDSAATMEMMDMLLGKKRADDRRSWLQNNGDLAGATPSSNYQSTTKKQYDSMYSKPTVETKIMDEHLRLVEDLLSTKYSSYDRPDGLEYVLKAAQYYDALALSDIDKWLNKYLNGYKNRKSVTQGNPTNTYDDDINDTIINAIRSDINMNTINEASKLLKRSQMAIGNLLEEYLAEELATHGWYMAWGETVKSTDLVSNKNERLQVKNRNNTENSSSSQVRNGTDIIKWHRLNANNGAKYWDSLVELTRCRTLSEERFKSFIERVVKNNNEVLFIPSCL
ncbi:DNA topoisomerase IV subunit B [Vibrio parahaemolyticus]|nr:DNA topoisomerase IV subunit B [Vibrio parahaemolyticus]